MLQVIISMMTITMMISFIRIIIAPASAPGDHPFYDDYYYDDNQFDDRFYYDNHPASVPGDYSFMMIITMETVNLMISFIMIIIQPVCQVFIIL